MTTKSTPGPCPPLNQRRPLNPADPRGYLESDRDFALNNLDFFIWCAENHKPIKAAPDMLAALSDAYQILLSRGRRLGLDDQGPVLDKVRAAIAKATS